MRCRTIAVAAVMLAACGTSDQEAARPELEQSATVTFEDSALHAWTPEERTQIFVE